MSPDRDVLPERFATRQERLRAFRNPEIALLTLAHRLTALATLFTPELTVTKTYLTLASTEISAFAAGSPRSRSVTIRAALRDKR